MQLWCSRAVHVRVSSVMECWAPALAFVVAVPGCVLFLSGALAVRVPVLRHPGGDCRRSGVVLYSLPCLGSFRERSSNNANQRPASGGRLFRLPVCISLMGFVSLAYWIFAPGLMVTLGGLPPSATGGYG